MEKLLKKTTILLLLIPCIAYPQDKNQYIAVSYSSICCGTPSNKPMMDFLKSYQFENALKPFDMFFEYGLGLEGEYNLYIGTDNLKDGLLDNFWYEIETVISN